MEKELAETLYAAAEVAQHEFWRILGELEDAMGIEIDANNDLGDTCVESLLAENDKCACGEDAEDGEGYDGKCGSCADKAECPSCEDPTCFSPDDCCKACREAYGVEEEDECNCADSSWYGPEHQSACPLAGLSREDTTDEQVLKQAASEHQEAQKWGRVAVK